MRLAMSFWEAVWSGDLVRRAKVAPGSPLKALLRLYGARGPALVVGVDRDEEPDSIGTSTEDVGGGIRVTEGRLRFGAHSQAQFALFWRQGSGALLEVEAFPLEHLGYGLMLRDSYGALLRERLAAFLVPPPAPAAELGPTPAVLLQHAARLVGPGLCCPVHGAVVVLDRGN